MDILPSSHYKNSSIRVEKIGGDDSFQMRQTLAMLKDRHASGDRGIYVFSAFKDSLSKEKSAQWNTTDLLIEIAEGISHKDVNTILTLQRLGSLYIKSLEQELVGNDQKTEVLAVFSQEFEYLTLAVEDAIITNQSPNKENDYSICYQGNTFSLMGWGEMLVSQLYSRAMEKEQGWINTYGEKQNATIETLRTNIAQRAMDALKNNGVAFVPGYSGNLEGGLFGRVGRGYSDWTAGNLYAAIRKHYSEENVAFMLKKLFSLSSADPRKVKDVVHLTHISYKLLLEMIDPAGADAGFVNRAAATPEIFRNNGYMKVYNDSGKETLIDMAGPENPLEGIQFIQSRRVRKLRIHSYFMNRDGYFAFVTNFLAQAGCSIINDSSDATNINLMIATNKKEGIEHENTRFDTICSQLQKALKQWEGDEGSEVSVTHNSHSLLFAGGENINKVGVLAEITSILAKARINLGPVVQTDEPKVIVFGVHESEEERVVQLLHTELIAKR